MFDYEVDTRQIDVALNTFGRARGVLDERMRRGTHQTMDVFQAAVQGYTPVNFGTLRDSIQSYITGSQLNYTGRLTTPLPYGEVVELGRKPGKAMPPVDAIKMWVTRKGLAPPEQVEGVAWAIAITIAKKGTKGHRMFEQGFEQAKPDVIRFWQNLAKQFANDLEANRI